MELNLVRGDTWNTTFVLRERRASVYVAPTPINLTGATARLQLRTTVTGPVVIEATTINSKLVVGGTNGLIELAMPPADTVGLLGTYLWDLELTYADGVIKTVAGGRLVVTADITR